MESGGDLLLRKKNGDIHHFLFFTPAASAWAGR